MTSGRNHSRIYLRETVCNRTGAWDTGLEIFVAKPAQKRVASRNDEGRTAYTFSLACVFSIFVLHIVRLRERPQTALCTHSFKSFELTSIFLPFLQVSFTNVAAGHVPVIYVVHYK